MFCQGQEKKASRRGCDNEDRRAMLCWPEASGHTEGVISKYDSFSILEDIERFPSTLEKTLKSTFRVTRMVKMNRDL